MFFYPSGSVSTGGAGQRPWVERDGLLGSGNRPVPPAQDRMGRSADSHHPSRPHIKVGVGIIDAATILDRSISGVKVCEVHVASLTTFDKRFLFCQDKYGDIHISCI